MGDIACIYEMNMLEENEQLEKDILAGRGMDILLCIMERHETARDIARRLGMPIYSVQLYLKRLVKAHLIEERTDAICNGQIEKSYGLVSDEIEIINRLEKNMVSEEERRRRVDLSAHHFASMARNAIKNVNMNADKPNKIKAYFMKAQQDDMEQFKKEIDAVFEKYQAMEDLSADETYSLFTVLAPYEVED